MRGAEDAASPIDFEYAKQHDFPSPPDLPDDPYRFYVDVWERTVTQIMDSGLRDSALHGADTCTRKQVIAQVKWCPLDVDPEDRIQNPRAGNSQATITLLSKAIEPDPCDPCAKQINVDSQVGNYLFRLEVHAVKGPHDSPTEITLKWSTENGAIQVPLLKDSEGNDISPPSHFLSGKWSFEFFDETSERHLGVHLADNGWIPTQGVLSKTFEKPSDESSQPNTFVRRWDGFCTLTKNGSWGVTTQHGTDEGDSFVSTDGDKFTINLSSLGIVLELKDAIVAGDYWIAEVREAEHSADTLLLDHEPPQGIQHAYLTLATASGETLDPNPEVDRKYAFPPLTQMTHFFYAGGDGQEAIPDATLPQPLCVGVANGEWPVEGAKVKFEIITSDGSGTLTLPGEGAESASNEQTDYTDTTGLVKCNWTLGPLNSSAPMVKVTLLDPNQESDTPISHPPLFFYANLSKASDVYYDPSEKSDCWNDVNNGDGSLPKPLPPFNVQHAIDDIVDHLQGLPDQFVDVAGDTMTGMLAIQNKLIVDTKIGIGTSLDPSAKLSVIGGVHIGGESDPGNNNLLVEGDCTIGGNLTVQGTTTTVNTQEMTIEDNIITLNRYDGSSPNTRTSGIEVYRGSEAKAQITWNETEDRWEQGTVGQMVPISTGGQPLATGTIEFNNMPGGVEMATDWIDPKLGVGNLNVTLGKWLSTTQYEFSEMEYTSVSDLTFKTVVDATQGKFKIFATRSGSSSSKATRKVQWWAIIPSQELQKTDVGISISVEPSNFNVEGGDPETILLKATVLGVSDKSVIWTVREVNDKIDPYTIDSRDPIISFEPPLGVGSYIITATIYAYQSISTEVEGSWRWD